MLEISLALLAGILTIAAPCILLPLPILLGASVNQTSKTRPLFIAIGFTITFASLALGINLLVQNAGLGANTLRNTAAILLGFFGLFMIWPAPYEKLTLSLSGLVNSAGQLASKASKGNMGGLLVGMVIGIVWAPCAGPILASILTLVARQEDLLAASILLVAYSLGAGIPMLVIAYSGQYVTTKVKFVAKYSALVQRFFGVIIVMLAIAIFFQYDTLFQAKLLESIPTLNPKY